MGLDMYLKEYKEEREKAVKKLNKIGKKSNETYEIYVKNFKEKYKNEKNLIKKFKDICKKHNIPLNEDDNIDEKIFEKIVWNVLNVRTWDVDDLEEMKYQIKGSLFNFYPICGNFDFDISDEEIDPFLIEIYNFFMNMELNDTIEKYIKKTVNLMKKFNDFDMEIDANYPIKEVGYWRKANHIHRWFTELPNWNEDEQGVIVTYNDLQELKSLCQKILKDHSKAKELLPLMEGFFFGDNEISDWYFRNLEYTVEIINQLNPDNKYKYYAWW